MGRTVAELLDGMDAVEWQRWVEYAELDPFTEDRADLRAAMVAATVAQVKGLKCRPSDFMPRFGPPPEREPMTDDEMYAQALKLNAMLRGKVRQRKPEQVNDGNQHQHTLR